MFIWEEWPDYFRRLRLPLPSWEHRRLAIVHATIVRILDEPSETVEATSPSGVPDRRRVTLAASQSIPLRSAAPSMPDLRHGE